MIDWNQTSKSEVLTKGLSGGNNVDNKLGQTQLRNHSVQPFQNGVRLELNPLSKIKFSELNENIMAQ